jgi:hypothetical protein
MRIAGYKRSDDARAKPATALHFRDPDIFCARGNAQRADYYVRDGSGAEIHRSQLRKMIRHRDLSPAPRRCT